MSQALDFEHRGRRLLCEPAETARGVAEACGLGDERRASVLHASVESKGTGWRGAGRSIGLPSFAEGSGEHMIISVN